MVRSDDRKFNSSVDNKTWQICELPAHKKSLGGRWVFALKIDENGKIVKYKARYVANVSEQIFGSDYSETFTPTAKISSFRMLLALATHFHSEIFQFNVSSAYLKADLVEDMYVEQPPGFENPGKGVEISLQVVKRTLWFKTSRTLLEQNPREVFN